MTWWWSCSARPWPLLLAAVQCLALWCISQCARAAAKPATMASRTDLPYALIQVSVWLLCYHFWCAESNSLWLISEVRAAPLNVPQSSSWCEVLQLMTERTWLDNFDPVCHNTQVHWGDTLWSSLSYYRECATATMVLVCLAVDGKLCLFAFGGNTYTVRLSRKDQSLCHSLSGCPCCQCYERGYTPQKGPNPCTHWSGHCLYDGVIGRCSGWIW